MRAPGADALNPRKQECLGHLGYGTGWFSVVRELHVKMAKRMGAEITVHGFCYHCPALTDCAQDLWNRTGREIAVLHEEVRANQAAGRDAYLAERFPRG